LAGAAAIFVEAAPPFPPLHDESMSEPTTAATGAGATLVVVDPRNLMPQASSIWSWAS
jgi:hypothetical protein